VNVSLVSPGSMVRRTTRHEQAHSNRALQKLVKKLHPDETSKESRDVTLKDKRVLVLGGTSGIGLAVAEAASTEGSNVVVVSSQQSRVDAALARLSGGSEGFAADLSVEGAVEAMSSRIGPFDHLVFTAGDAIRPSAIGDADLDGAKDFFGLRFWGAVMAAKYGGKLIRKGGSIVLTSSTLPRRPSASWAIGASISSAVEGLARALAVELAPVRVNVVAPGIVRTPFWNRLPEEQREAYFETRGAALPVGRGGWANPLSLPKPISS
jgi:NAD(P)-dependent dehydrogenase (short-subunit alcohol dehydrogenase family)